MESQMRRCAEGKPPEGGFQFPPEELPTLAWLLGIEACRRAQRQGWFKFRVFMLALRTHPDLWFRQISHYMDAPDEDRWFIVSQLDLVIYPVPDERTREFVKKTLELPCPSYEKDGLLGLFYRLAQKHGGGWLVRDILSVITYPAGALLIAMRAAIVNNNMELFGVLAEHEPDTWEVLIVEHCMYPRQWRYSDFSFGGSDIAKLWRVPRPSLRKLLDLNGGFLATSRALEVFFRTRGTAECPPQVMMLVMERRRGAMEMDSLEGEPHPLVVPKRALEVEQNLEGPRTTRILFQTKKPLRLPPDILEEIMSYMGWRTLPPVPKRKTITHAFI